MDVDEPAPRGPTTQPLDAMSIEDLTEYVAALKAEIGRAEAMIAAKRQQRDAADAIFGA